MIVLGWEAGQSPGNEGKAPKKKSLTQFANLLIVFPSSY